MSCEKEFGIAVRYELLQVDGRILVALEYFTGPRNTFMDKNTDAFGLHVIVGADAQNCDRETLEEISQNSRNLQFSFSSLYLG